MSAKAYPISTSEDEFRRLNMQAELFHDDADAMLGRIGVEAGWHCLDLCCGNGGITGLLAEKVGPTGSVLGADVDPVKLAYARDRAAENRRDNIRFVEADAFATGLSEQSFDLVHCRFALSVIPNGLGILDHMVTLVRPGGVICVEEANTRTMQCVPDTEDWRRGVELMDAVFAANGANVKLGPELYAIFRAKGISDIEVRPCVHGLRAQDPMTMHVPATLAAMRENILSFDLISGDDLDAMIARLYDHLAKPDTLTISVAMIQVAGRAP